MKIIVKNVKGEIHEVQVELSDTHTLQESKGYEASLQKLVLRGKQTSDDQTVEALQLEEGDFLKVNQPKSTQVKSDPQESKSMSVTQPNQTTQATLTKPFPLGSNSIFEGDAPSKIVVELCSMGFEKEQVIQALRETNPDRATETLLNGIPNQSTIQQAQPSGFSCGIRSHGGGVQEMPASNENPVSAITNNQQLRVTIQQNPVLLQGILNQLAQSDPQLFQLISQNQEAFMQLLMEEGGGGAEGGEEFEDGFVKGGERPITNQADVVQVTQEDKEAIDRLIALGFDQKLATEAYLLCNKNEEMTVNYLFESKMGDLGPDGQ